MFRHRPHILAFIFILLVACNQPVKDRTKDQVIIREGTDASTLNPVFSSGEFSSILEMHIFQSLLGIDFKTEELVGVLAESAPEHLVDSNGKSRFHYQLRADASFDDGSEILAKDVLFSLKVNVCPTYNQNAGGAAYHFIEDFTINSIDPRKFTFHCIGNSPFNLIRSGGFAILQQKIYDPEGILNQFSYSELRNNESLSKDSSLIQFAAGFEDKKHAFDINYIGGSGAYKVKEWEKGQYLILEKKNEWWANKIEDNSFFKSTIPKIRYEIISDPITAITALKSGKIDFMKHVPAKDFIQLEATKDQYAITTQVIDKYAYQYIGFNINNRLLKDKSLRQALAYAIPREKIIEIILHGQASAIYGPFSPIQEEFKDKYLNAYRFDIEKSKKILEESGWVDFDKDGLLEKAFGTDTLSLNLNYTYNAGNQQREAVGVLLQSQLKELGISLEINAVEWSVYLKGLRTGKYDLFYGGTVTLPMLPNYTSIFSSSSANGGRNYANYQSEEMDSLIQLLNGTSESEEILESTLDAFTLRIQEDIPYYFLFAPKENIAYSQHLKNVSIYSLRPNYWAPEFVWE